MPQAQAVIDEIQEEAKQYNRIYVASVHPELTEDDIKNVFEAFGPITYCKLAHGTSAHKHKGYGFIEYATLPAALEAIASMNLFDLGGQYLRVGRAITPPNALAGPPASSAMPTAAAVAAAAATAKIQAMDAVASNAVALGLTKLNALGVPPAAALPTLAAALPVTLPVALPVHHINLDNKVVVHKNGALLPVMPTPSRFLIYGERLGLMQSLAGLAAVLSKFDVSPAPGAPRHPVLNPAGGIVQSVVGGIPLVFRERSAPH
ncbi:poly(U)-binding-splicing factor half pint-like [Zerene cesonia]|uniref:poly(U)-binding-splicing factor half pint-like n=1 Tax=Zerene cesonia TaxID=33412 RepID=UPI0018E53EB4|nr:poly(U)-binding-splicing factor half pint-like [Zerene cesonia]